MHNRLRCLRQPSLMTLCASTWAASFMALLAQVPVSKAAQDASPKAASPAAIPDKSSALRVTFLPPPLEGTLSVGVYDRTGKRVRSLHVEATNADFSVGLNGLSTTWDGKDDAGQPLPPGKYRFKGFAVGDLELTGEAFHGNEWVASEDGPRPVHFHSIKTEGEALILTASDLSGNLWRITEHLNQPDEYPEFFQITDADTPGITDKSPEPVTCAGRDGTVWKIEKAKGETVVVQYDPKGKALRRLTIGAGQPVPVAVAASQTADEVFLLEQDGDHWQLRGLRKRAAADKNGSESAPAAKINSTTPVWETFLDRQRWPCSTFAEVSARVGRAKPFISEPQITVKTQFNPLLGGENSDAMLSVGFDDNGSFLKTTDGLILRRLTDTTHLKWAVLGHDVRQPSLVLLQSDGAVIEEYRILEPDNVMAFDAGDYQWPPK